jgi:protein-S-isoprenylcysteine O-methyltransferase Ste14
LRRRDAATGSAAFFLFAPVVVAGVMPWALTMWESGDVDGAWVPVVRIVGGVALVCSVAALVHSFARFVVEGRGTPAPVAPTERLVIGGLYRYVRNPMYLAVVGAIIGQAFLLLRPVLLAYAALVWAVVASFVRWYEEPTLMRQFGAQYASYRRSVRAWIPRLTPWPGPGQPTTRAGSGR